MKAMIYAAGIGKRLYPITDTTPKALVEVDGKPMLYHLLEKLSKQGITEVVINIHHFAEKMKFFIKNYSNPKLEIGISNESSELLDTGGALLKAKEMLNSDQPILLHNADVFSDFNLPEFLNFHVERNAMASLLVNKRDTSRYLVFDENNDLLSWKNKTTGEEKIARNSTGQKNDFAFTGIQIISPEFINHIPFKGKFSIIDVYLKLAKVYRISALYNDKAWFDIGTMAKLEEFRKYFADNLK